MYSRFLSLKTASGNPLLFTAKASGKAMCFRSVLIRFSSDKRIVSLLRTQHDNSRVLSLHGRYPASSLLWTPPTPDAPAHRVMDSPAASGLQTPAHRVSQVPRPFLCRAPSASTPVGRSAALAGYFAERAGFVIFGRLATYIFAFRGRILGSTCRLTAHHFVVRQFPTFAKLPFLTGLAPRALLPPHDSPRLHVQPAIYMATSFQVAGKARFNLTHQRSRSDKECFEVIRNVSLCAFARGIMTLSR